MEQLTRLLAVGEISHLSNGTSLSIEDIPACARLSPLTLESSNSLLSPLGSHLRSNSTMSC